jgi:hypothetical protein
MPHAGAFPFAYCAEAIKCLMQGHSHLLIAQRPFDALHEGIPICLLRQGHSTPCTGAFPFACRTEAIQCNEQAHSHCLSRQGYSMPHAGAFPFAYCTKAIRCLLLLLIAPRPFYASRWGTPICSSRLGHCLCFYQASHPRALTYQESSSFALLGDHSCCALIWLLQAVLFYGSSDRSTTLSLGAHLSRILHFCAVGHSFKPRAWAFPLLLCQGRHFL